MKGEWTRVGEVQRTASVATPDERVRDKTARPAFQRAKLVSSLGRTSNRPGQE
ncbi:hypothetical protein PHLCEN_2v6680 [Hermanssonia centrifuga]|uniref:Uncharacterized protein n=1 Tax=Hermanssonia centrifuga TaxID=98765 RepID=A0A2R6NYP2_9APHY|nr:hypothetical protein PHLCEN_2v6680 [Hermanssonia centrifuga]